jgi:hypothetical protein
MRLPNRPGEFHPEPLTEPDLTLALRVFHCGAQNFDAIGGAADIDWPPAPIASEAYDPQRKSSRPICCIAQHSFSFNDVLGRGDRINLRA